MRWNDLPRSLVFGAFAALLWIPAAPFLARTFGAGSALVVYAVAVVIAYTFGLAPTPARGLRAAVLVAVLSAMAAWLSPAMFPALLAVGAALALVRSGVLYRARPARSFVVELLLVIGGLQLAAWVAVQGSLGVALGLWTFFLVQGLYFLIGGIDERSTVEDGRDPFESAKARALRLMES